MGGPGSDGEMSTTNLFNSLILHFNPSLIPSLFPADACQGLRGGGQSIEKESGSKGGLKRRKRRDGCFMERRGTLPFQA